MGVSMRGWCARVLTAFTALLAACSVRAVTFIGEGDGTDAGPPTNGPAMATITVARGGAAMGSISAQGLALSCAETCTATVPVPTTLSLVASPDPGAVFGGWSGDGCAGSEPTCTLTVTRDVAIAARFDPMMFTVEVAVTGDGAGLVTSLAGDVACPGMCTVAVPYNTSVTLLASPATSSTFGGWGGGCSGGGGCTFTVTADTAVTAAFVANQGLTVARDGTGGGTVTSSPAGIACGTDCTASYPAGTVVTLTAVANDDSSFAGWSGAGCTGTGVCRVTTSTPVIVTATFVLRTFALTVARTGTGTGTVTSTPTGISCGADCSETYDAHQVVTLTAASAADSVFAGWSGGCTGTAACVVTMDAAVSVTASFARKRFALSVARGGTGAGSVSSDPAGISCGADCSESYDIGTAVTLTAAPDATSTFTGWTGGGCSGTGTCQVTMAAAVTVTATFTQINGLLAVANFASPSIQIFPASASGTATPLRTIAGTTTTFANLRSITVVNNEIVVADVATRAIDFFPVTASGDVAPTRRIVGPSTGLVSPAGLLVFNGEIYVGQENGVISVFPLSASGDVPPSRTITGIGQAEDLAIAGGELFVADFVGNRILVFAANASGAAVPLRVIAGAATGLHNPAGLVVSNGEIFIGSGASAVGISVYPQFASGDVAPLRVIAGSNTGLSGQAVQIAISAGELYVTSFQTHSVVVFPVGATGNVTPTRVLGSTVQLNPAGISVF